MSDGTRSDFDRDLDWTDPGDATLLTSSQADLYNTDRFAGYKSFEGTIPLKHYPQCER